MTTDIQTVRRDAVESATKAVEMDDKENYEEAYKLYKKAAEKLSYLSKIDENQYNKDTYKKKAFEYCERAKLLKEIVDKKDEPKAIPSGGGGAGGKTDKDDPDAKLKDTLASCVITEKPNVKWEDVAGLEKAKEALQEAVILPLKYPHFFLGKRKPWKGILLYGVNININNI